MNKFEICNIPAATAVYYSSPLTNEAKEEIRRKNENVSFYPVTKDEMQQLQTGTISLEGFMEIRQRGLTKPH